MATWWIPPNVIVACVVGFEHEHCIEIGRLAKLMTQHPCSYDLCRRAEQPLVPVAICRSGTSGLPGEMLDAVLEEFEAIRSKIGGLYPHQIVVEGDMVTLEVSVTPYFLEWRAMVLRLLHTYTTDVDAMQQRVILGERLKYSDDRYVIQADPFMLGWFGIVVSDGAVWRLVSSVGGNRGVTRTSVWKQLEA